MQTVRDVPMVRELAEATKSCSKQHKKVVFDVAPAAVKLTKEAQPIANFSLAAGETDSGGEN